jgi:deltex-like protein
MQAAIAAPPSAHVHHGGSSGVVQPSPPQLEPFHVVQCLSAIVCRPQFAPIKVLSNDNARFQQLVSKFLACHEEFRQAGKAIHINVGFHYTRKDNLESIRQKGLWTGASQRHGAIFGKGIYIGNNPHAFLTYGDLGIVVIYILGASKQLAKYDHGSGSHESDALLGNKLMRQSSFGTSSGTNTAFPKSPYFDEIVLRTSAQVLPLFTYDHWLANNSELLFELKQRLQWQVDQLWKQRPTPVRRILPSVEDFEMESRLRQVAFSFWLNRHDKSKPVKPSVETVECYGPKPNQSNHSSPYTICTPFITKKITECPICMCEATNVAKLHKCQHGFHQQCIDIWLKSSNNCPVCRVLLGDPKGKSPRGTMTIKFDDKKVCNGKNGVYVIEYSIPAGTQSDCHENPGHPFDGAVRTAYVPSDGQDLIKRLKYAFKHGLTFTVGTSLTTGRKNTVTWASIHHKTTLHGGLHGFPDHGYQFNANEELDNLGVPKAADL